MGRGQKMKSKSKVVWKPIPDEQVRCVWGKEDAADHCDSPNVVWVSPDWYERNGTPCCACGEDMVYLRTEIKVKGSE